MIRRICAGLCLGAVLVLPVLTENAPAGLSPAQVHAAKPVEVTPVKLVSARLQSSEELSSHGSLPGIVQPSQRVELLAPADGILSEIPVKEGQWIRTGQVLVQLDDSMAKAAVRVAEAAAGPAEVKLAQVDLKLAQAELQRMLSIPDRRALADVELDRAKAAVERADAAVNRARQDHLQAAGTLDVERRRLQQLHLKAPFDGVVVRVSTQKGASVVRAIPLITVANLSTLKVELFADLKHFSTLRIGQDYVLDATAPVNRALVGRLVSREPLIDAATKTFRCVFEIANTDGRLPAGFTVQFSGEVAGTNVASSHHRQLRAIPAGHK